MNDYTIGQFLSLLRKSKGYTQQNVADALNVSNKTVSGWERDVAMPDANFIPLIAELYDVTCDEILKGRKDRPTPYDARTEAVSSRLFLSTFSAQKTTSALIWTIISCLFLAGSCLTALILVSCGSKDNFGLYYALSLPFIAIALATTLIGYFTTDHMLRMHGKDFVQIRKKIFGITRGALLAEIATPFALMPILFASDNAINNVLFSTGFLFLSALVVCLADNLIRYCNKDLCTQDNLKKNLVASAATTAAAVIALSVCLPVIYEYAYVGKETVFEQVSAEFDDYDDLINALTHDPLKENCISASLASADDDKVDMVYTFKKETDVIKLLAPYSEYYLYRADDVYILYISFRKITLLNLSTSAENDLSMEKVVVSSPEYLYTSHVNKSDGKYKIVAPVGYAVARERAFAVIDLIASAVVCGVGVLSLCVYLTIASIKRKSSAAETV